MSLKLNICVIKTSYRGGVGRRVSNTSMSGGQHEIIKPINLTTQWHKHEHLTKKTERGGRETLC